MALVLTQEGAQVLWQQLLGIYNIGNPFVRLFGQAVAPSHGDTLATYTPLELAVGGYAPLQLIAPSLNWQITVLPSGAQAVYPVLTWNFSTSARVFGYWLNDASGQYSLVAEAFPASYLVSGVPGAFSLQLPLSLTSQP